MKNYTPLLSILQIITISVSQPVQSPYDSDDSSIGNVHNQEYEKVSVPSTCNSNQYFDEEQEHCLNIAGGGTLLYIDKAKSCGVNVLKPHCSNPKHYYICKNNKAILAQCGEDQQFSYDLQKCISNHQEQATKGIYSERKIFDSMKLPTCEKSGSFLVPEDCALFYTCEIKDGRLIQFIFKCPNTMIYDAEMQICSFYAKCNNTNLNSSSVPCESDTEKGRILSRKENDSRNINILNETSTTGYSSNPPQFTKEDTTVATNNYESIATDESNSFDTLNSTENILDTTYSLSTIDPIASTTSEELNLSFQTETTYPSFQTSTSETTTEDFITSTLYSTSSIDESEAFTSSTETTSAAPLQTSTEIELNLNNQTDAVITSTMNPTSYSQTIDPFATSNDMSMTTEININESLINSSTKPETSDQIKKFTEHSTTEFSSTDFTSTISSIKLSVSPQYNGETTTSNFFALDDLFVHKLPTTTTDPSISISTHKDLLQTDSILTKSIESNKSKENSTSSALLDATIPDTTIVDKSAFSSSTDAANYFTTVTPKNVTYDDELIDTPSDMKEILQNFTSTLSAVSSLESILATLNNNSTLNNINKQPCEEILRSLLADIKKRESFLKTETDAEKQNVTVSQNVNSRRRILSHIALPLASAVLNITDRFEHRIRNILRGISTART